MTRAHTVGRRPDAAWQGCRAPEGQARLATETVVFSRRPVIAPFCFRTSLEGLRMTDPTHVLPRGFCAGRLELLAPIHRQTDVSNG